LTGNLGRTGALDDAHIVELSAEAKVAALNSGEIKIAKELEKADLVFLVPDGSGGAVITPRARDELCKETTRLPLAKSLHPPPEA